jgi:formylglycine-generating enzyme required for sulfatase activity
MVWIEGGSFQMGAQDSLGRPDEYPAHRVTISGFWMDETEVTNQQFREFVQATGYTTTAEIAPDWEVMKKQLPAGTRKPDRSELVAASLVFVSPQESVDLEHPGECWLWTKGANWMHPQGPGSSIEGRDQDPVVQVSYDDACAYAHWAKKRLPTEAEWEFAARGGLAGAPYAWGTEPPDQGGYRANIWQGEFPTHNDGTDGFIRLAPVRSFKPNAFGLYDLSGNVWEWCLDWYDARAYSTKRDGATNPRGPTKSFDPAEPLVPKRVARGGSFLCDEHYCTGYRVSARMRTSPDTSLEHTGFRCVKDGTAPLPR